MTEPLLCPACGAAIPPGSPAGLCPKCLMQAGLESGGLPPTKASPAGSGSGFTPPTPEELAARFPQFEILELLGRGGMGAVYKARQRSLDRLVAVKILPPEVGLDPSFAERFAREAKALARLSHPHIVAIHDFGQVEGQFFLVMEFVDGVNLRQALRAGDIHPAEALAIVPQVCEALQFAHDEGIVHRDIKPENILLDRRGRVKIADFGLAKLRGGEGQDHTLTGTHQVMGTLKYMAPEQMEGTREVDHRADIYSLGVVFYELLTGEVPFGRFTPPSHKVQIDVRLDEVVLRALEHSPEQRYQHVSQVKTEVEAVSRSGGGSPSRLRQGERGSGGQGVKERPSREELERIVLEILPTDEIGAVRAYREATGCGLSEARDAVDLIGRLHGVRGPNQQLRDIALKVALVAGAGAFLAWLAGERGWLEQPLGQVGFGVGIVAMLAYFGGLLVSLQGSKSQEESRTDQPEQEEDPAGSKACPAPGASTMILFCGAMLLMSLAIILAGVACLVIGLVNVSPDDPTFWGWMGGAVGCILGGLGSLAGTWNSYRQIEGAEDLMQSPRWHWLDTALALVALAGVVTLIAGAAFWNYASLNVVRSLIHLGGIVTLLGGFFVVTRSMMRQVATERSLGGDAGPGNSVPTSVMLALGGVLLAVVVWVSALVVLDWEGSSPTIVMEPNGPQLSEAAIRKSGLTAAQVKAANEILERYHQDYLALERSHTQATTDIQGRLHVVVAPFALECQALAERARKELGGVAEQRVLPRIELGRLPPEIFREGGECEIEAELWKEQGDYLFRETRRNWVPAPGVSRGPSSLFYRASTPTKAFPERFRVFWSEAP